MIRRAKSERYIVTETNRHGATVYYFRKGSGPRIRLPEDFGSDYFWDAYQHALASEPFELCSLKERARRTACDQAVISAINRTRDRATKRGIVFELTREWGLDEIRKNGYRCPETGIPYLSIEGATSFFRPYVPSIDRVVPALGYVPSNVRIVIFAFNAMLSDWGADVVDNVMMNYQKTQATKNRLNTPIPAPGDPAPRTLLED